MVIKLRTQSKDEIRATSIGTTRSITPRVDLIGPSGAALQFVRPLLGNSGPGQKTAPPANWTNAAFGQSAD